MVNVLKTDKQEAVIASLLEGMSIRSVERLTGVHRDTIGRLALKVGQGCARLMDERMQGLTCAKIQLDEIWSFVAKKQRNVDARIDDIESVGDMWTFVAMDADSKLVPAYRVDKRTGAATEAFVADLAGRLKNRPQLSSDQWAPYAAAIAGQFRSVDYAQVVKTFRESNPSYGRYSPAKVTGVRKFAVLGEPIAQEVSTSFIERQNLSIRMGVRRFTRLTNAFSKDVERHTAAVSLWFCFYNFSRVHRTLRVTPAMEAGVSDHVWSVPELLQTAMGS